MKIILFDIKSNSLLENETIFDNLKNIYTFISIISFLPKSYWQKRGLYLLLNHTSIAYTRLPDPYDGPKLFSAPKSELLACFNPITIAKAMQAENPEWLPVYIKHEFNVTVAPGTNPFEQKEFLGKLIKSQIAALNHSNTNDIAVQYIMPLKNVFLGLQRFPNKAEKAKPIIQKIQTGFFDSYNISQLLFLLEGYVAQFENNIPEISTDENGFKKLFISLTACKSISINNFGEAQLLSNLYHLSQLYNGFIALKNEQPK
ncbi:MAG: hypothetical protein JJE44_02110 [Flavobacteriaceae bacterium]|nr:hypothetical protein [Flavobacteriaceae bacterium]